MNFTATATEETGNYKFVDTVHSFPFPPSTHFLGQGQRLRPSPRRPVPRRLLRVQQGGLGLRDEVPLQHVGGQVRVPARDRVQGRAVRPRRRVSRGALQAGESIKRISACTR